MVRRMVRWFITWSLNASDCWVDYTWSVCRVHGWLRINWWLLPNAVILTLCFVNFCLVTFLAAISVRVSVRLRVALVIWSRTWLWFKFTALSMRSWRSIGGSWRPHSFFICLLYSISQTLTLLLSFNWILLIKFKAL